MPLFQCEYCGNVFNNVTGQKICPNCSKELDGIFTRIRKYMYSTEELVTAAKLVEELGVSEKAVEYLIRDERLILNRSVKTVGRCKICGAPTSGDSLCEKCRKKFTEGMQKYREEKNQKTERQRSGSVTPLARSRMEEE